MPIESKTLTKEQVADLIALIDYTLEGEDDEEINEAENSAYQIACRLYDAVKPTP